MIGQDERAAAVYDAVGKFAAGLARAIDSACTVLRKFAVVISAATVANEYPQVDRLRLTRHLQACSDPYVRAGYMLSQARRGHIPPLLA